MCLSHAMRAHHGCQVFLGHQLSLGRVCTDIQMIRFSPVKAGVLRSAELLLCFLSTNAEITIYFKSSCAQKRHRKRRQPPLYPGSAYAAEIPRSLTKGNGSGAAFLRKVPPSFIAVALLREKRCTNSCVIPECRKIRSFSLMSSQGSEIPTSPTFPATFVP